MKTTDVVFALRADAREKPGGDVSKISRYQQYLQNSGLITAIATSVEEMFSYNPRLVHLINLDLPLENLRYAKAAKTHGIEVALSSIAHPLDGLKGLYKYGDDVYYKAARAAGLSFERGFAIREYAKLLTRLSLKTETISFLQKLRFQEAQQYLLRYVDIVLPQNSEEEDELRRRFQYLPLIYQVPNGVSFEKYSAEASPREFDNVIVGRVEPRKNTLEIARALSLTDQKSLFLGGLNENHRGYTYKFASLISEHDSLTWLGRVPPSRVRELLSRSIRYINLSWCEISSQSDIEAFTQGCRMLTTKHCFISSHLSDVAREDPLILHQGDNGSRLLEAISRATLPRERFLPSWSHASNCLRGAYSQLNLGEGFD